MAGAKASMSHSHMEALSCIFRKCKQLWLQKSKVSWRDYLSALRQWVFLAKTSAGHSRLSVDIDLLLQVNGKVNGDASPSRGAKK